MEKIQKTENEWRKILTKEQFNVLRKNLTEIPNSGKYYHFNNNGLYLCAACDNQLFNSKYKYDSGSGWPSFYQAATPNALIEHHDNSHGMQRIEIVCARCDSHIGHMFNDGPEPTGLRYCVNSVALKFLPHSEKKIEED